MDAPVSATQGAESRKRAREAGIVSRWADDDNEAVRPAKKAKRAAATLSNAPGLAVPSAAPVGSAPSARPPREFTYGCRSVDVYEQLNVIDEGQFGVVYRAAERASGRIVALKKLKMEREVEGYPVTSLREIATLFACRHPNVVEMLEVVRGPGPNTFYMAMEYVDHELRQLMIDHDYTFSMAEMKTLMRQMLSAVAHMHRSWVVHRDLKTSNVLYSNRGQIKVADFGLAREYSLPPQPLTPLVVTLWYRAPELLLGAPSYGPAIDLWSVGCIFAEILTREPLIRGEGELDQIRKMCALLGTPTESDWPGLDALLAARRTALPRHASSNLRVRMPVRLSETGFSLLTSLLCWDPSQRVTAAAALAHAWFSESPLPQDESMMPTFASANEDGFKRARAAAAPAVRPEFVLRK